MKKEELFKVDNIVNSINNAKNAKYIKEKDGLIETVNLNKVVLTEDNKMLLND